MHSISIELSNVPAIRFSCEILCPESGVAAKFGHKRFFVGSDAGELLSRETAVSFTGPTGIRHSIQVTAETLCVAAITDIHLLRQEQWTDNIRQARGSLSKSRQSTTHTLTVAHLRA
jgi:hypothetical protein